MGLSKEQQRKLIKAKLAKERPQQGIKRLIKGKVVYLSKKENTEHNEAQHKKGQRYYARFIAPHKE